jgi:hypothetical protein
MRNTVACRVYIWRVDHVSVTSEDDWGRLRTIEDDEFEGQFMQ